MGDSEAGGHCAARRVAEANCLKFRAAPDIADALARIVRSDDYLLFNSDSLRPAPPPQP